MNQETETVASRSGGAQPPDRLVDPPDTEENLEDVVDEQADLLAAAYRRVAALERTLRMLMDSNHGQFIGGGIVCQCDAHEQARSLLSEAQPASSGGDE